MNSLTHDIGDVNGHVGTYYWRTFMQGVEKAEAIPGGFWCAGKWLLLTIVRWLFAFWPIFISLHQYGWGGGLYTVYIYIYINYYQDILLKNFEVQERDNTKGC